MKKAIKFEQHPQAVNGVGYYTIYQEVGYEYGYFGAKGAPDYFYEVKALKDGEQVERTCGTSADSIWTDWK